MIQKFEVRRAYVKRSKLNDKEMVRKRRKIKNDFFLRRNFVKNKPKTLLLQLSLAKTRKKYDFVAKIVKKCAKTVKSPKNVKKCANPQKM
jgi:hypothetical protein